ncbi:MAG: hypothetical protein GOU99_04030 [Candidatus Altiarchaeota archaeon]|nr:hypothetical protein [Candidatus Altiarchaeota archaeon]
MGPIARRYFVMNAFDGVMTAMGIVLGGAIAIGNPLAIFKAGFGASLAIMVSGFWGAFMTERAERTAQIRSLERQLLRDLNGSYIEKDAKNKIIELAIIDAISPFLGAIIPLFPFLLAHIGTLQYKTAILVSVSLSLSCLFLLGVYLSRIMKENFVKTGLIFAAGGIFIAILAMLFEGFF